VIPAAAVIFAALQAAAFVALAGAAGAGVVATELFQKFDIAHAPSARLS